MFRYSVFLLLATLGLLMPGCKETRQIDTKNASAQSPEPSTKSADKKYSVEVPAAQEGGAHFAVKPASGFKINLEYPWKVEFKTTQHGELTRNVVKRGDGITLDESEARVDVPLDFKGGESTTVEAVASFSVCNDDVCKNYRDEPMMLSFNAPDSAPK